MENFKLDLTKLTPVAEKDRVKGNWYVVADGMGEGSYPVWINRWHSGDYAMRVDGKIFNSWSHWFAIPPNLPGFPVAELPDEIEFKEGEWEYYSDNQRKWRDISGLTLISQIKFRRIKPKLPSLSIPEQTASERREWLQKELEKLNK